MKPELTAALLCDEARQFAVRETRHADPKLFGVTDGKAVGTYIERKFRRLLLEKYTFEPGNSSRGTDLPGLKVDIKVTSHRQPQSSCPYRSARQKIYGLGYSLLVFVYDKQDDPKTRTSDLNILHTVFVEAERTADYTTTTGIRKIVENNGKVDDIVAFLTERRLPVDEPEAVRLAEEILRNPPEIGYLTISNALQWRLQYQRAIDNAGTVEAIHRLGE